VDLPGISKGDAQMTTQELHEKYAPILRFNKDEHFFPMRADALLPGSSLYVKGADTPLVPAGQLTPALLQKHGRSPEVFVRTVTAGPLFGRDLVTGWSHSTLEMIYRWAAEQRTRLSETLARKAYSWFSPRNNSAAQLFWWNSLITPVLEGKVGDGGTDLPRLILPAETQAAALAHYQEATDRPEYTYYYREVRDGRYLCLQYWFFYAYNDWGSSFTGFNDHEGDWEGMMLFFQLDGNGRPQEPPTHITYADHESRQTKRWDDPGITRVQNHPVGFVGAGSHATYPEAKTHPLMQIYNLFDFATGDGLVINHDDWSHRLNLNNTSWLAHYKGSWGTSYWLPTETTVNMLEIIMAAMPGGAPIGLVLPREIGLPGVSAPRGPVSIHRPQFATPVHWAGLE
jgi:hypothetical protein